jgi:hypothetical protein
MAETTQVSHELWVSFLQHLQVSIWFMVSVGHTPKSYIGEAPTLVTGRPAHECVDDRCRAQRHDHRPHSSAASRAIGINTQRARSLDGQMPSTSLIDVICDTRRHVGWHRAGLPEPAQEYGTDLFGCHGLAPLDQICNLGIVLVLGSAQTHESDRWGCPALTDRADDSVRLPS